MQALDPGRPDPQASWPASATTPQNSDHLATLLFSFQGRIGRKTWWLWAVGAMLGMGLLLTMLLAIAGVHARLAGVAVNLLLVWPALALSAKRWHDRGKSAWWLLIVLIPLVGPLWAFVENGLLRGTPGPNRFGPPPAA